MTTLTAHHKAAATAREWLSRRPVFLDTETTGLDGAQICDIALLDTDGGILLNTLVRPTVPIPPAAAVHGITDADVAGAPPFRDVWLAIRKLLAGRDVVVYNAGYDQARLLDSARAVGLREDAEQFLYAILPQLHRAPVWRCAMQLYAGYRGEWNEKRGGWKWQKLGEAARQCGIELSADMRLHRALADAELAR